MVASVPQDVYKCSRGRELSLWSRVFHRHWAKQTNPSFCSTGLPGVFNSLKTQPGISSRKKECAEFPKLLLTMKFFCPRKILKTCGGKCVSWEVQALFSLAKNLSNDGSKITSTMWLSHFRNYFNSIYLSTFNMLWINEFISRGWYTHLFNKYSLNTFCILGLRI